MNHLLVCKQLWLFQLLQLQLRLPGTAMTTTTASVVTVIETGTETAFFCKTEPNQNRGFMPLYWRFGFEMEQLWCLER